MHVTKLNVDNEGQQWVRAYLLGFKPNERGWFVNRDTAFSKVLTALKKPLVLHKEDDGRLDHPAWDSLKSVEANFVNHAKKAIGTIEKILFDKDTDAFYADVRITDPAANNFLKKHKENDIPLPVSPQLVYNSKKENIKDLKDWFFSHLAVVTKGAFGPEAKIIDSCNAVTNGEESCFQNQNASSPFNFCVESALAEAEASATLHSSQFATNDNSKTSMEEVKPQDQVQQQNEPIKTNDSAPSAAVREAPFLKDVPRGQRPEVQQQETVQQEIDYKKAFEEINPQFESLKKQLEAHNKELESIKAEKRKIEFASVIPPQISKFRDKNGAFSQKMYNEHIEEITSPNFDLHKFVSETYSQIADLESKITQPQKQEAKAAYASSPSAQESEIVKVPTLAAEASEKISSVIHSIPQNGKRRGRLV
jgi:hypothetical protein